MKQITRSKLGVSTGIIFSSFMGCGPQIDVYSHIPDKIPDSPVSECFVHPTEIKIYLRAGPNPAELARKEDTTYAFRLEIVGGEATDLNWGYFNGHVLKNDINLAYLHFNKPFSTNAIVEDKETKVRMEMVPLDSGVTGGVQAGYAHMSVKCSLDVLVE